MTGGLLSVGAAAQHGVELRPGTVVVPVAAAAVGAAGQVAADVDRALVLLGRGHRDGHDIPAVAVENLDQGGYLVRAGMSGSKFYTFTITEKGLAALPALSGKEAEMAEEFLNPLYVQLLKVVKENPEQQAEFVQKNGIKSMRMSAICSHLTRRGYVVEGGLFKRKLRITEKGAAALQKYA